MTSRRVVLVTGASAGIGRATCLELARRGCTVVAAARSTPALQELKDQAAAEGGIINPIRLDVRDLDSRQALIERLAREDLRSDVLVNNAGIAVSGPLLETGPAAIRNLFETNTFGPLALTQLLVRPMIERGSGRIINVSSTAGRFVAPMAGAYSASKFAVEALSDALRRELSHLGVAVIVVEPGAVDTGFAERSVDTLQVDPGGPYATLIPDIPRLLARAQAGASTAEEVAVVIADAALTPKPRLRYITPTDARTRMALARVLPTRLMDTLLRHASGLFTTNRPHPRADNGATR